MVAVRLGALVAGRDYHVDVQYEVPDSVSTAGMYQPALRVELLRRSVAQAGVSGLSNAPMTGRLEMQSRRALGRRARIRLAGAAARQYQLSAMGPTHADIQPGSDRRSFQITHDVRGAPLIARLIAQGQGALRVHGVVADRVLPHHSHVRRSHAPGTVVPGRPRLSAAVHSLSS